MLAEEIQLLPDKTFFIQLAIFLGVVVSLNYFVFKPVLKLIQLRRTRTKGEKEKLEDLKNKTESLIKEYEGKLLKAKQEGFQIKESIRKEGEVQAQKVIHEAKQAGLAQLEKARGAIEKETEAASKHLEKEAQNLGKSLAEKILGR